MRTLINLTVAFTVCAYAPLAAGHEGEGAPSLPAPVTDADYFDQGAPAKAKVELGRLLFFDKVLSGNRNISCGSCHHPALAGADAVALPLGEGPKGLGPDRRTGASVVESVHGRVPRNTPALFNLGARAFERMFHDGRVEVDKHGYYESGFITPAKWKLPRGLDNVLAAQAMFPPTSPDEMAGHKGENPVADAISLNNAAGPDGVWALLAQRLKAIPKYVELFRAAYPQEVRGPKDISMVLAANAIAAFEATAFRADNSPFDEYLRTGTGLTPAAGRGARLFYGKAECAVCHSGKFQTDHSFHAIAMPQIGPGKADGHDANYWRDTGIKAFLEDFGRGRVTVRKDDNYKFRTPSLRNVTLTGPWGHAGAYGSLEAVVRHHLDPVRALNSYQVPDNLLPQLHHVVETRANGPKLVNYRLEGQRLEGFLRRDSFVMRSQTLRGKIAQANELTPVDLSDGEISDILAFLVSLTDPSSKDLNHLVPKIVPSGLPVAD